MKRITTILFAFTIAVFAAGCEHGVSPFGQDMIEEVGTAFSDTITLNAFSLIEDTVNTTNTSANLIGSIHDPVFGDTKASTYAQFALKGASANFGQHPVIDSVVLTLQISSYFGDTLSGVGIRVYELSEEISKTDNYYSNSSVAHNSTPLNYSLTSYQIHPSTNIVVDTNSYNPHLRIRLAQSFGQSLLDNPAAMTSTNEFQNFFKGLCITAVSHTGSTGYMLISNMNSSLTGIILYYHNDSKANAKYTFPCNNRCRRFTNYTHNYNTSTDMDFVQEVVHGQHALGENKLFLQANGGVKTHITFPNLAKSFQHLGNRVVINRAELVISNVDPDNQYLTQPAALSIQGIKKGTGAITYIPDDEYYTSSSFYGGTYDANKHEYRFRMTRYVQEQILGTSDLSNSINLVVKGSSVRANRLIFGGPGLEGSSRLRLELSYTTY